jgi:hypothetical protein
MCQSDQISESRVLSPRLRAFLLCRPGQSCLEAAREARLGPAYMGPSWPGLRPEAGPDKSLVTPRFSLHL